ncbi:MAG: hypothetical protein OXH68_17120 [Gammaproteobacteria bacterium]|nr:hypothetical protein [Gammaproteobacteria bacterium]
MSESSRTSRRKPNTEVLAFDCGQDIVGILDIKTGEYLPYRGGRMIEGARRILDCAGEVVSYNGIRYDLDELAEIVGVETTDNLALNGEHRDMQVIASARCWPPDEGTEPILGTGLVSMYERCLGGDLPDPPSHVIDEYERSNWRDCYMAGELWKELAANWRHQIDMECGKPQCAIRAGFNPIDIGNDIRRCPDCGTTIEPGDDGCDDLLFGDDERDFVHVPPD